MAVMITGGSGFIGGHLIKKLQNKGEEVVILDKREHKGVKQIKKKLKAISREDLAGIDAVYHLAAEADVKAPAENHFDENVYSTFMLLQKMREAGVKEIIFTSSSTVYGEPPVVPTPESYGPLKPISMYGASKLACEAFISSFCFSYDMEASIFRLANVIGKGCHGVINDFIRKLNENPKELEILGDGKQRKSYLHVDDAINGILMGREKRESRVEIYNLGSDDWTEVKEIASIISKSMRLSPEFSFRNELNGRGWVGDVKTMLLDCSYIKSKGWRAERNSRESVERTVQELLGL
jgi:UDP-glucose 4-epimerase